MIHYKEVFFSLMCRMYVNRLYCIYKYILREEDVTRWMSDNHTYA